MHEPWMGCVAALVGAVFAAGCGDPPAADDEDGDDAGALPADAAPPDGPVPVADAGAPDGMLPLSGPDLTLNPDRVTADLSIESRTFPADACELTPAEDCIGAPGDRTLLRFSVETPNIGTEDLHLGSPFGNPEFEYSSCHMHYHFTGYASYRLVDGDGNDVALGHKQAFCLLDSFQYVTDDSTVATSGKYDCTDQGIQRGWSDVYHAKLPCQWIDITDTPAGDYTLVVDLNAEARIAETSYANNTFEFPVSLADPGLRTPTEACPAGMDAHSSDGLHRECGWELTQTMECNPGDTVRIGCAAACSLGACTGDPILRVCDHAKPDGNCSFVSNTDDSDDACGSKCPRVSNIPCPASGQLDVYTAPFGVGDAYSCELALVAQ